MSDYVKDNPYHPEIEAVKPTHRRGFLKAAGAMVALPAFESLLPELNAATVQSNPRGKPSIRGVSKTAGLTASGAPMRMAFLSVPNGVNLKKWRATSEGEGDAFQLNSAFGDPTYSELKHKLQIIRGLDLEGATAGQDGGGDHARANASYLTACRAFKTSGSNIRLGISVDQIAALAVGEKTRFASLQLGTESGRKTGSCDSGYSCAYQYNISWASETLPLAPEANPRVVFEKLFGDGTPDERKRNFVKRLARRKSILDAMLAEARQMRMRLGSNDQRKMDEYLNSVRSIEKQIERAERFKLPVTKRKTPAGIPDKYSDHLRLMFDMMVLAFQTDSTRIITMPLAHDGSNRNFLEVGVSEGHHSLSHHRRKEENLRKIAKIDRYYCDQFAYLMKQMDKVQDVDGKSLLDNTMLMYGGGIADGDRHSHMDLPIVLAGGSGAGLKSGRAWHANGQSLGNLYVGMLERMGVKAEWVGDSTGKLSGI